MGFTRIMPVVALLLCLSLLTGGCLSGAGVAGGRQSREQQRTIRIAYLPITHALPLFAAKEYGADGIQIELVKYGSWPELMDALDTGKADGALVLIELAVKAREQGIDLKAAALGHKDGNVIITAPGISSVSELRGTAFAIPHKQSSHKLLLDQLLTENGMSENDLQVVELSPPEMPAALAQGQISGYCVAEPFGAKSVIMGTGKVFARSEDLWPDSLCCALVFNGDFLRGHKELARDFVHGYQSAGERLTDEPAEQQRIAAKYLKAKEKVLALSLEWISYQDLVIHEAAYDELIRRMKQAKLIEEAPSYADFVDNSLWD